MKTWTSVIAAAAVSLLSAGPSLALQGTIIVKGPKAACGGTNPYNVAANGGWAFSPTPPGPADYDLVVGPLVPPAGAGSLSETTLAGGPVMAAVNINPQFAGVPLVLLSGALAGLTYSNLDLPPVSGVLPTLTVFVDLPGGGSTDDNLVFFPAANGCAGFGAWSTCGPLPAGLFFNSNPIADPDGNPATPFTLAAYVAFNPAAQLPALPNPGLGLLLGTGPPPLAAASAFADNLILDGVAPLVGPFDDIQFDFEADCSAYGGDADADCHCDTANPLVLIADQCPGADDRFDAPPADGNNDTDDDGVRECADNCPFDVNPTQDDADDDGLGDVCDDEDALGLSVRRVQLRKKTKPNTDVWSAQAALDATASPNFLSEIASGGVTVTLTRNDSVVVDTEVWSSCVLTANGGSARCKNAAGSVIRFNKRFAPGFFKVVINSRAQSLTVPTVLQTPLTLTITSPVAIDRNDAFDSCELNGNGNQMICLESP